MSRRVGNFYVVRIVRLRALMSNDFAIFFSVGDDCILTSLKRCSGMERPGCATVRSISVHYLPPDKSTYRLTLQKATPYTISRHSNIFSTTAQTPISAAPTNLSTQQHASHPLPPSQPLISSSPPAQIYLSHARCTP